MRQQSEYYIIANMGLLGNKGRIDTYTWAYVRGLNDAELESLRADIANQRLSY
jgi:cytochrome c553